jgi:hypothetical protein
MLGRQAGRQADKQADKQAGKQAARHAGRQACRQADKQTSRQTMLGRQAGRQAGKQADKQAGKQGGSRREIGDEQPTLQTAAATANTRTRRRPIRPIIYGDKSSAAAQPPKPTSLTEHNGGGGGKKIVGAHLRPTQPSSPQYIRALHDFQVHSAPAPPRGLDQGPRLTDLPKRVSSHSLQGDKHHARYGDRRHA